MKEQNALTKQSLHIQEQSRQIPGRLFIQKTAEENGPGLSSPAPEQAVSENQPLKGDEQFRLLANHMQHLAWMANSEGAVHWYNSRWYDYTGTAFDEMQGWGWKNMLHPEHADSVISFFTQAWKTNQPFEITHLLRSKDGHFRWFISRGTPVCDANGNILQWVGTLTDIDEQKKGEDRFRSLADLTPLWVWFSNKEGHVDYANQEMLRYLGFDHFSLISREMWQSLVHPEDRTHLKTVVLDAYQQQQPYTLECRIYNQLTGEYEWFVFQATPRLLDNRFDGFVGTGANIHARKMSVAALESHVEERTSELNKANAALHRSNEELQQFAHVASHDLKEPVRKVLIFNQLLQQALGDVLNEKAKGFLAKIESAASRMGVLIESILKYSSLQGDDQPAEPSDLNILLKNVESDLEISIAEKAATIAHSNQLPVITGIPIQLQQLLYNIINNSLKFARKDVPPVIKISSHTLSAEEIAAKKLPSNKGYITICIADNGIGFNQSSADHIFKTYYRLNSKDQYDGTGLGLSLCKRIAERHGGTIEAEGVAGEGALFKITLPQ